MQWMHVLVLPLMAIWAICCVIVCFHFVYSFARCSGSPHTSILDALYSVFAFKVELSETLSLKASSFSNQYILAEQRTLNRSGILRHPSLRHSFTQRNIVALLSVFLWPVFLLLLLAMLYFILNASITYVFIRWNSNFNESFWYYIL